MNINIYWELKYFKVIKFRGSNDFINKFYRFRYLYILISFYLWYKIIIKKFVKLSIK